MTAEARLIGVGVLAGGLYHLSTTERTRTRFGFASRQVTHERRALFRTASRVLAPLDSVRGYAIRSERDSEGEIQYRLVLHVNGVPPLPLGGFERTQESLAATASRIHEMLKPHQRSVGLIPEFVTLIPSIRSTH